MAFTTTRTPRPLRVNAADLFLLERWDRTSPLTINEQRDVLATEYVCGGVALHCLYYERLQVHQRVQHPYLVSSLPEGDQSLLTSIRAPDEQNAYPPIWLRTCYLDDEAYKLLYDETRLQYHHTLWDEGFSVLDDHARFDFGREWQKIFSRVPQLVDSALTTEAYEKGKSEALEETNDFGESPETDSDSDWTESYSSMHRASVVGYLWIADKKALSSRKVLLAWYDDCGRIVRSCRVSASDIDQVVHLLLIGAAYETGLWSSASIGKEYDVDGAFGPPQSEDSGE